jgi:hypothetical protein
MDLGNMIGIVVLLVTGGLAYLYYETRKEVESLRFQKKLKELDSKLQTKHKELMEKERERENLESNYKSSLDEYEAKYGFRPGRKD